MTQGLERRDFIHGVAVAGAVTAAALPERPAFAQTSLGTKPMTYDIKPLARDPSQKKVGRAVSSSLALSLPSVHHSSSCVTSSPRYSRKLGRLPARRSRLIPPKSCACSETWSS